MLALSLLLTPEGEAGGLRLRAVHKISSANLCRQGRLLLHA